MAIPSAELEYIRRFVRDTSAIVLDDKDYLIEARLGSLAISEGHSDLLALLRALRAEENGSQKLHHKVVDALTTNETSFFRDVHPFEAIRKTILPELIERNHARKTLRMWSAACSSGQEPVTLAMIVEQHFPQIQDWRTQILGTDLSDEMLIRARKGRYSQIEVNRGLPAPMLVRFFEEHGGEWIVRPEVMKMIRYERFNFVDPWPPRAPFDLILLRNVMIYFDVPTKREIVQKIGDALAPGGYLILGASETIAGLSNDFDMVPMGRTAVCRRK